MIRIAKQKAIDLPDGKKGLRIIFLLRRIGTGIFLMMILAGFQSCKNQSILNSDPDIHPLHHGIRATSTVAYCASIANSLFNGDPLPENVLIHTSGENEGRSTALLMVTIDQQYPVPFNQNTGQLWIACIWDPIEHKGVISAVFTDIDILEGNFELHAIYTIPVFEEEEGRILTIFAEQDIVIGEGSDTLLNISLTQPAFFDELERLGTTEPENVFVAVKQNVWIITVLKNNSSGMFRDEAYLIYGGGQIGGKDKQGAGVLYHAMLGLMIQPENCLMNPTDGNGFIQNLRAGEGLDLGHIFLDFHQACDGQAYVTYAHGKYLPYHHRNVNLNLN